MPSPPFQRLPRLPLVPRPAQLVPEPFTWTNSFEGGTNGVTLTPANSGGASGQPFDNAGSGAGTTLAYDSTYPAHGSIGLQIATGATSSVSDVIWNTFPRSQQVWFRLDCYLTAYNTNSRLVELISGSSTEAASIAIGATGLIIGRDANSGTLFTFTTAPPLNTEFRIEGYLLGDPANGVFTVSRYDALDSSTPTETKTATGANTAGWLGTMRCGVTFLGAANAGPFWIDDVGLSNQGPLGPALGSVPVTAALSGSGSLGGAGPVVNVPLAAALSGSGALTANDVVDFRVAAALAGVGVLGAAPTVGVTPTAALTGLGVMGAGAVVDFRPRPALAGVGVLGAAAAVNFEIAAALSGTGVLSATAVVGSPGYNPLAALSGFGVLLATAIAPPAPFGHAGGPPPLNPTVRYFPPGLRRFYWVPSIANISAPARAELDAGIDLTSEIRSMSGWSAVAPVVEVADFGARFTAQLPGRLGMPPSSLMCYLSQDGRDVRSVLSRGMFGFVAALWEGDIAGLAMDVYPVRVAALSADSTVEDPGQVTVGFTGTSSPALYVPVPSH